MIFVDTNYFLRFLLNGNKDQNSEAKKLFLAAALGKEELISSNIVFFEISWVLGSSYKLDKSDLVVILRKLLQLNVDFNDRDLLIKTIDLFNNTKLSLEDCYNLIFSKEIGVKEFRTFDVKLLKQFKGL